MLGSVSSQSVVSRSILRVLYLVHLQAVVKTHQGTELLRLTFFTAQKCVRVEVNEVNRVKTVQVNGERNISLPQVKM